MNLKRGPKMAKMADWVNQGNTPQIVFNKFELKTMQKAILNCLQVSNVIANLPTGFGKSLLFQYPASLQKLNDRCVLVIVPLKALLWDTIRQARDLGIVAEEVDNLIITNYYKKDKLPQLLVATPQKIFATQTTLSFLQSLHASQKIRLLVIDQCHCMSQWGHDFRPAYLQLATLKDTLSGVRILAISATLTPEAREDLVYRMYLQTAHYFQASYHRGNLFYAVVKCTGKQQYKNSICNYLIKNKLENEPGIIYCQTIQSSQKLYQQLSLELKVGLFHSKISQYMRKQVYDGWISGRIKTIVGTICFGMGINKKDIRYVINVGISKSPQAYYQESGRAGRDGKQAHCVLLSYPSQTNSLQFLISQGTGDKKLKSHQLLRLQQMIQYADSDLQCRRVILFRKLGEHFLSENCGKSCDICRQQIDQNKIKKLNFYEPVKKILEQLQNDKVKFTKKQLITCLMGKIATTNRRGKPIPINFSPQIQGIFSKQKVQVVQKIIETLINKNLLLPEVEKTQRKFMIAYLRPANRAVTKNFKQFFITIKQKQPSKEVPQIKVDDKFAKFLQKKKNISKGLQIKENSINKANFSQALMEGQALKCDLNEYESFFTELFKNQNLQTSKQEDQRSKYHEQQGEDCVLMQGQIQQQPGYIDLAEQGEKPETRSTVTMELNDGEIQKLIQQDLKKKRKQKLKRSSLDLFSNYQ